jgi:hypothetical protein
MECCSVNFFLLKVSLAPLKREFLLFPHPRFIHDRGPDDDINSIDYSASLNKSICLREEEIKDENRDAQECRREKPLCVVTDELEVQCDFLSEIVSNLLSWDLPQMSPSLHEARRLILDEQFFLDIFNLFDFLINIIFLESSLSIELILIVEGELSFEHSRIF